MTHPDVVSIKGLPPYDGEYPFDIVKLVLTPGDPEFMTYREWHTVKTMSGVRAGEVMDALDAGDTSLNLALVAVILRRAGRAIDENDLWDAPGSTEIRVRVNWAARQPETEEGDADPPASEPPVSDVSGRSSTDGGEPSRPTLVSPESAPSPTGVLGTAISARTTLAG